MNFSFTDDQQLIRESAQTYLSSVSSSSEVRKVMATERGFSDELWQSLSADMFWQATHVPEEFGGLGLGYVELALLLEQCGEHLLCAPLFSTACLGVNALRVAGTEQQLEEHGAAVAEGARYTLAYAGSGRSQDVDELSVTWGEKDGRYVLNGTAHHVIDGHSADWLIVAARSDTADKFAPALFIVPNFVQGVRADYQSTMDQTRKVANVSFENVQISAESVMRRPGDAGSLLQDILDLARIGLAAELSGVATKSLDLAVSYVKEREQFGRAVGSFQALKHKAADMMLKAEAARSAVYYAACVADEYFSGGAIGCELHEAASIAKAYCAEAAFYNAGSSLQMHGGVGFTWEYDIHMYFKRAKAGQLYFGDSASHKEKLASALLDGAA